MLLGASSEALEESADLGATTGAAGDTGVVNGEQLVAFAEAAHSRESVAQFGLSLGPAAFVEAAATVAIFNGLVRTADASGIPLDDGTQEMTVDARAELGLNEFRGAANSRDDADLSARPVDLQTAFD